jgi:hypothetical protein
MPADADVVWLLGEGWIRVPGGNWQTVDDAGAVVGTSLLGFYATPSFFIHQYRFSDPVLPAHDTASIEGTEAKQVILRRDEVIAIIMEIARETLPNQETVDVSQQNRELIQENAREALPDDFEVEVWIAEEQGYPVRIIVTFSVSTGDEGFLISVFPAGARVTLQIDITDTDTGATVEPPIP